MPVATASNAISTDPDWRVAIGEVLASMDAGPADVMYLFVSPAYRDDIENIVRVAWEMSGSSILLGCASNGVIGGGREIEVGHAISLLSLSLPGVALRPVRFTPSLIQEELTPQSLQDRIGIVGESVNSWLLMADPVTTDLQRLLGHLDRTYPEIPVVGGAAAPMPGMMSSYLMLNGSIYRDGAIGLAVGGDWRIEPILSQGCEPIGETWTITSTDGSWIESISNRPATDLLKKTLRAIPAEEQQRVSQNVVVGLATDEYQSDFERGDFMIRNIIGYDTDRKRIRISGDPRVGQTLQFHLRDAATADLDLKSMLLDARQVSGMDDVAATLLFTCNGRGQAMFGAPDHDVSAIDRRLGPPAVAGMRCAGEIGPVGKRSFLHGFSASIACFLPNSLPSESQ